MRDLTSADVPIVDGGPPTWHGIACLVLERAERPATASRAKIQTRCEPVGEC
ncbi:hypothetical protein [Streptosporangium sp. NPDC000396]|uniref:hypothetical protein n=1 Tax=Streptosporangium sp. NPDC000396 TaxID=3366185 RepID=UPI00367A1AF6